MAIQRATRSVLPLLLAACSSIAHGQQDSTSVYERIERFATRHKVTQWMYDAVFVPTVEPEAAQAEAKPRRRHNPALRYEGRPIRRIEVHVMDPFGYSVRDTSKAPTSGLQGLGNALHRRTRERIVRNLLLVHEGEAVDALRITESERVLRANGAVNDAAVTVVPIPGRKDSVDVQVLVHDKWNLDAYGEGDLGSVSGTARDRNLLGWGQELEQRVIYEPGSPEVDLEGHHSVYNIRRSYISSRLQYSTSADVDQVGLSFDRGFYSPVAKWAGGLSLSKTWIDDARTDTTTGETTTYLVAPVGGDAWLARSFPLSQGGTRADRSSNLILGIRYAQVRYANRTPFDIDSLRVNSDMSLALVSVGLSFRQYYKDRYLYRFGANEDVPEGSLITVTTGARKRELEQTMPYLGFEVSRGVNTDAFGYFSGRLAYGTFYDRGRLDDATLRIDADYVSDLQYMGRWHLRQFVRIRSSAGFSKEPYQLQSIGGRELYGFNGDLLLGTSKVLLNLETVAYMPYNLLGFRFAPVALVGFGTIAQEDQRLLSQRIYPAFSLGVLVRNENLLVKTFEVALGYYPLLPDGTTDLFRLNPSISFSLNLRDFAYTRPDVVGF